MKEGLMRRMDQAPSAKSELQTVDRHSTEQGSIRRRGLWLAILVLVSLVFSMPSPSWAGWSCVPYARSVSDINVRGDAWMWWNHAAGVYIRSKTPKPGSVLVFQRTHSMRRGHVAVVRQVVSNRKVIVDHANWGAGRRGKVDLGVGIVDVSPNNDWSQTRVWYAPIDDYGSTVYPTNGFIYPDRLGADKKHPRT
jgi:surface antigen